MIRPIAEENLPKRPDSSGNVMANGIGLWGAELAAHFRLVLLAAWQHGMAWLLHEAARYPKEIMKMERHFGALQHWLEK